MPVDAAAVHRFFENYGWKNEYDQETTTWHTGFRGNANNFNIFVHLTENWIYFTITPFIIAPLDEECGRKLHRYLLRLNHAINMAKFSLDQDGDVVLTVELPTENLDYSEFADALNALSFYADAHYVEILNVAQDVDFVPTFGEAGAALAAAESGRHEENAESGRPEEDDEGDAGKGGAGSGTPRQVN